MKVIYEDNHVIVVNKDSGEIAPGDKTGDTPLSDTVKEYIRVKYNNPGHVLLGGVRPHVEGSQPLVRHVSPW